MARRVVLTNARGAYATSIAQYTIAAILRVAERMDLRREAATPGALARRPRGGPARSIGPRRDARHRRLRRDRSRDRPPGRGARYARPRGQGQPVGPRPTTGSGARARAIRTARSRNGSSGSSPWPTWPREADFVSVTLPLTARSRGVVSREVLAALPASRLDHQHRAWPRCRRGGARRDARGGPDRRRRPGRVRRGAPASHQSVLGAAERRDHAPRVRCLVEELATLVGREPPPLRRRRTAPQSCRSAARVLKPCRREPMRVGSFERSRRFLVSHTLNPRTGPSIALSSAHAYVLVKITDADGRVRLGRDVRRARASPRSSRRPRPS